MAMEHIIALGRSAAFRDGEDATRVGGEARAPRTVPLLQPPES